jgi:hypothetical protein
MNGNLVVRIAATGILAAIIVPLGLVDLRIEQYVWIGLAFVWTLFVVRGAREAPFTTALTGGLAAGFVCGAVRAILLWDSFLANAPELLTAPNGSALPAPTRTGVVVGYALQGGTLGLLAGIGAWISVRLTGGPPRDKDAPMAPAGTGLGAPDSVYQVKTDDSEE